MAARQPKKPTLREVVVTVVACAVVIGVGANLWSQWLTGHTAQPEYEEEDNDE
ncbi:hypothetical protein ACYSUO_23440 [Streptomyces sp. UC4497]